MSSLDLIKNNKYLKYVKSTGNYEIYMMLLLVMKNGWLDELQEYLNTNYGTNLAVDGIIGFGTLKGIDIAMAKDKDVLVKFIDTLENENRPKQVIKKSGNDPDDLKSVLMNFLAHYEGTVIHYNRGENHRNGKPAYTTPYGVYSKVFPKAKIISYVDSLFRKYGLNKYSVSDIKAINRKLTNAEKIRIKELAFDFYVANFMNKKVLELIDPASALTYLSISINGGKGRGAKAIQSAIGAGVDGAIGPGTLKKLKSFVKNNDRRLLNRKMLEYMQHHYDNLIRKNPGKYKRFEKGWYRRLLATKADSGYTNKYG